jgi:hypothetical protein
LRRVLAGDLTQDAASLAHGDRFELRVELWPFALLTERCWQLRGNVTIDDGPEWRWPSG